MAKRGELDDDREHISGDADDDKKGSGKREVKDAKRGVGRDDSGKPLTDAELRAAAKKAGPEGKRALTALLLKGNLNA
jgi:hypothetical protein